MSKEIISTNKAPGAIGPYSQAVRANGMIFCSGQIPINPATNELVEGVEAQTRQVMENIKGVLEECNLDFSNIVKTTIFLTDMNQFGTVNSIYGEYFPENPPARATVQVSRLPKDVEVEIDFIAVEK